jgi:hypothetical protein
MFEPLREPHTIAQHFSCLLQDDRLKLICGQSPAALLASPGIAKATGDVIAITLAVIVRVVRRKPISRLVEQQSYQWMDVEDVGSAATRRRLISQKCLDLLEDLVT